jgi:ribosome maturation factor RimP
MNSGASGFLNNIRKMAEEISAREGCYLYDLEFVGGGGGRTLRVYIDKDDKEGGGVSLDDCSNVSKGLNALLDADEALVPGGQYNLEVSSPGLERALKERRHFEKVIGQKVTVKSFAPLVELNPSVPELGKAKQVVGALLSYEDAGVKVDFEGKEVFVPHESIAKAHVVYEFETSAEDSEGKGPNKNKGSKTKPNKGQEKS